jgi:hypothetical protein
MPERFAVNKSKRSFAKPLSTIVGGTLSVALAKQGFASTELVSRWPEIVGAEVAAHSEPIRIIWKRGGEDEAPEPATLVLRAEGPAAIEIQHLSNVILERVNRFFGWQAVGRIALRQAPLTRPKERKLPPGPSPEETARIAAGLNAIASDDLRQALARLGAAIKRT